MSLPKRIAAAVKRLLHDSGTTTGLGRRLVIIAKNITKSLSGGTKHGMHVIKPGTAINFPKGIKKTDVFYFSCMSVFDIVCEALNTPMVPPNWDMLLVGRSSVSPSSTPPPNPSPMSSTKLLPENKSVKQERVMASIPELEEVLRGLLKMRHYKGVRVDYGLTEVKVILKRAGMDDAFYEDGKLEAMLKNSLVVGSKPTSLQGLAKMLRDVVSSQ